MLKRTNKKLKVTVKQLAVAFFFSAFLIFLTGILAGPKINKAATLINKIATLKPVTEKKDIKIEFKEVEEKKRLSSYPNFGDVWATILIPSLGIDLSIYHGDTLDLIKYAAGHLAGSYFPGEGGTIVLDAHNTTGYFKELPNINYKDKIIIKATYGTYTYSVDKTEIIEASILGQQLEIRNDKEILMLYTCYPTDTPGYKSKRFVVYASLVGEEHES